MNQEDVTSLCQQLGLSVNYMQKLPLRQVSALKRILAHPPKIMWDCSLSLLELKDALMSSGLSLTATDVLFSSLMGALKDVLPNGAVSIRSSSGSADLAQILDACCRTPGTKIVDMPVLMAVWGYVMQLRRMAELREQRLRSDEIDEQFGSSTASPSNSQQQSGGRNGTRNSFCDSVHSPSAKDGRSARLGGYEGDSNPRPRVNYQVHRSAQDIYAAIEAQCGDSSLHHVFTSALLYRCTRDTLLPQHGRFIPANKLMRELESRCRIQLGSKFDLFRALLKQHGVWLCCDNGGDGGGGSGDVVDLQVLLEVVHFAIYRSPLPNSADGSGARATDGHGHSHFSGRGSGENANASRTSNRIAHTAGSGIQEALSHAHSGAPSDNTDSHLGLDSLLHKPTAAPSTTTSRALAPLISYWTNIEEHIVAAMCRSIESIQRQKEGGTEATAVVMPPQAVLSKMHAISLPLFTSAVQASLVPIARADVTSAWTAAVVHTSRLRGNSTTSHEDARLSLNDLRSFFLPPSEGSAWAAGGASDAPSGRSVTAPLMRDDPNPPAMRGEGTPHPSTLHINEWHEHQASQRSTDYDDCHDGAGACSRNGTYSSVHGAHQRGHDHYQRSHHTVPGLKQNENSRKSNVFTKIQGRLRAIAAAATTIPSRNSGNNGNENALPRGRVSVGDSALIRRFVHELYCGSYDRDHTSAGFSSRSQHRHHNQHQGHQKASSGPECTTVTRGAIVESLKLVGLRVSKAEAEELWSDLLVDEAKKEEHCGVGTGANAIEGTRGRRGGVGVGGSSLLGVEAFVHWLDVGIPSAVVAAEVARAHEEVAHGGHTMNEVSDPHAHAHAAEAEEEEETSAPTRRPMAFSTIPSAQGGWMSPPHNDNQQQLSQLQPPQPQRAPVPDPPARPPAPPTPPTPPVPVHQSDVPAGFRRPAQHSLRDLLSSDGADESAAEASTDDSQAADDSRVHGGLGLGLGLGLGDRVYTRTAHATAGHKDHVGDLLSQMSLASGDNVESSRNVGGVAAEEPAKATTTASRHAQRREMIRFLNEHKPTLAFVFRRLGGTSNTSSVHASSASASSRASAYNIKAVDFAAALTKPPLSLPLNKVEAWKFVCDMIDASYSSSHDSTFIQYRDVADFLENSEVNDGGGGLGEDRDQGRVVHGRFLDEEDDLNECRRREGDRSYSVGGRVAGGEARGAGVTYKERQVMRILARKLIDSKHVGGDRLKLLALTHPLRARLKNIHTNPSSGSGSLTSSPHISSWEGSPEHCSATDLVRLFASIDVPLTDAEAKYIISRINAPTEQQNKSSASSYPADLGQVRLGAVVLFLSNLLSAVMQRADGYDVDEYEN